VEQIILGLAGLFFIGHFLQWIFVKTKIPDLLILILVGFCVGPSGLNIVRHSDLGKVGVVLATVTLIIILYEGGLNLNAKSFLFHQEHPQLSKLDLNKFHVDPDQCPVDLLCDVDEFVELSSSLDIAKASGPDNTSALMLKATACSIAPSVTKLFNICIRSRTLPSMWKCTNMVPIPKGKDMNQFSSVQFILI